MESLKIEERDPSTSNRSFAVTLVLCILLGYLGIHRFYVGKAGTGILMLITMGFGGIWWIIDIIIIAVGGFTDKQGKLIKP